LSCAHSFQKVSLSPRTRNFDGGITTQRANPANPFQVNELAAFQGVVDAPQCRRNATLRCDSIGTRDGPGFNGEKPIKPLIVDELDGLELGLAALQALFSKHDAKHELRRVIRSRLTAAHSEPAALMAGAKKRTDP
jgi:hypothetical protein